MSRQSLQLRRPWRRLFLCVTLLLAVTAGRAAPPEVPAKTTISDVVYRADGTPAAGTLLISWPAFVTADHAAVAAGSMSVVIGPGGAVSLALVPNEGADPAGTYYKIVLKLNDGSSNVEYWTVPAASPATLAAIRATIMPAGVAMQAASRAYVDTALAGKASDSAVLHNSGDETLTGVKQFSASPLVPTPTTDQGAANKAYVDGAVGVPANLYVLKAGDTLAGPLTLSGDPTAPGHAANRHYVDTQITVVSGGLAGKADKNGDTLNPKVASGVRFASQFTGADAGARLQAAIADLPASGGKVQVDTAGGAIPSDVFAALTKHVHLVFSAGTYTFSANATLPANLTAEFEQGALWSVDSGRTVTVKGSVMAGPQQPLFTGAGTVSLLGVERIYPAWYGAKGDGSTDDAPAINAAASANPSRKLFFPKTRGAGQCDYYAASTLYPKGSGQLWEGETSFTSNATNICFPAGVTGMVVDGVANSAYYFGLSRLSLVGSEPWVSSNLAQFVTTGTADGILVKAPYFHASDVMVQAFGRHGISINTTDFPGSNEDDWDMERVWVYGVRGDGFHVTGIDANDGACRHCIVQMVQGNGFYDNSFLGNTWQDSFADSVHVDNTGQLSSAVANTSLVRAGGVLTVTTSGAHNVLVGDVMVITGATSGFNSADSSMPLRVRSVADATHYTVYQPGADGTAATPGSSRYKLGARVWAQAGAAWYGASPYNFQNAAANNLLIRPYCEAGQPPLLVNYQNLVIGGTNGCLFDYSLAPRVLDPAGLGSANQIFAQRSTTSGDLLGTKLGTGSFWANALNDDGAFWIGRTDGDGSHQITFKEAKAISAPISGVGWYGYQSVAPATGIGQFGFLASSGQAAEGSGQVWMPNGYYRGGQGTARNKVGTFASTGSAPSSNCTTGDVLWADGTSSWFAGTRPAAYVCVATNTWAAIAPTSFVTGSADYVFYQRATAQPGFLQNTVGSKYAMVFTPGANALGIGFSATGTVPGAAEFSCTDGAGCSSPHGLGTGLETVSFSATPTFNCAAGNTHKITLTGNVTSSTLSNCAAGQAVQMIICQDATGNRTFTWPATMKGGMTIGSTASKCSAQSFVFDGTSAYATSSGVINQ